MFCPRCSQEQVNAEIKFCSRCGFALSDVAEALSNDGHVDKNTSSSLRSIRLNVTIGIALMILSMVFFVASLVLGTPEPSYVVQLNLLVMLIAFLAGVVWIGIALTRGSGSASRRKEPSLQPGSPGQVTAKLDQRTPDALNTGYAPPASVETGRDDLHSVTDDTTKFLKQDR